MIGHCPEVERLGAFVDGELPSAEADAVRAHVAACAACRERIAALATVDEALAFDDAERSDAEWEELAARVDRAVADDVAAERAAAERAPAEARPLAAPRRFALRPLAFGGAGVLAAAALVALFVPLLDSPRELPRPQTMEKSGRVTGAAPSPGRTQATDGTPADERANSLDRAEAKDREALRALGSLEAEGGPDLRAVKPPFDPGPGLASGAGAGRGDAEPPGADRAEADRVEADRAERAAAATPQIPEEEAVARRSAATVLKKELSPRAATALSDSAAPDSASAVPVPSAPAAEAAPAGTRLAVRSSTPKPGRPASPDTAFALREAAPPAEADTAVAEEEVPAPAPEPAREASRTAAPSSSAGSDANLESLRERIEERHRVGRTPTAGDGWGRNRSYRGDTASRATRERALTAALAQEMLVFAMEWEAEGDIAAARRAYLTLVSQDSEFRSVREQAWKELIELEAREALRSGDEEDLLLAVQTAEAFLREYRASALRSEVLRPRVRLWAALVRLDPDEHCSPALAAAAQWETRDLERPARVAEAAERIRASCLD